MPSVEYPRISAINSKRLYAFFWACVFFALFNGVAWLVYEGMSIPQRLSYYAPYNEVQEVLRAIKQDDRKKVVFIGGSVMWGSATPQATDTIPLVMDSLLPDEIAVYNLSAVALRPLDQILLAYAVKDDADLIVMDYNYEFGYQIDPDQLQRDRSTYVRMSQLFAHYSDQFLADVPQIQICAQNFNLDDSAFASHARSEGFMRNAEATLQRAMHEYVPLYRYKDYVNRVFFGRHPTLLLENIVFQFVDLLQGRTSFSKLWLSPEESIISDVWVPNFSDEEVAYTTRLRSSFSDESLHSCFVKAFSSYQKTAGIPLFVYMTPLNPAMFPDIQNSDTYRNNTETLRAIFDPIPVHFINPSELEDYMFADSTHLTPVGNREVAELLFQSLQSKTHAF